MLAAPLSSGGGAARATRNTAPSPPLPSLSCEPRAPQEHEAGVPAAAEEWAPLPPLPPPFLGDSAKERGAPAGTGVRDALTELDRIRQSIEQQAGQHQAGQHDHHERAQRDERRQSLPTTGVVRAKLLLLLSATKPQPVKRGMLLSSPEMR